jgi:MoaA/NifB/PqqE/SkfB family radical SAM enzyme
MSKLHERLGFKPRQADWELILRCNLRCRHCGSRAGRERKDELSLQEMFRIADQLGRARPPFF